MEWSDIGTEKGAACRLMPQVDGNGLRIMPGTYSLADAEETVSVFTSRRMAALRCHRILKTESYLMCDSRMACWKARVRVSFSQHRAACGSHAGTSTCISILDSDCSH